LKDVGDQQMTAVVGHEKRLAQSRPDYWLFSPAVDLSVFLGSALVALLALAVGAYAGILESDTPDWAWVPAVLLIDVAHVYASGFRVYFDVGELKRRPWLYTLAPVGGFVCGVALYSHGEQLFWRVLAYLAVFHFVRQQYGWVALYRAKVGERGRWGRWIDSAAIYLATIYPLISWHAHLPRGFWWFLENDFQGIPQAAAQVAAPIYWLSMAAYAVKAVYNWSQHRPNPGKDIVVVTTAVCWYVGIITFNSDYAFTVTNVIIHGVPYLALVFWYMRSRQAQRGKASGGPLRTLVFFLSTIWFLAYAEELIWDRTVLHERSWLFGAALDVGMLKTLLVPLLAVPQLTHYVLDGFIWRRKHNPHFSLVGNRTST
jgi:hypothetical protein